MDASTIKGLLDKHKILPNKALGQNFLCDDDAIQTIARAATGGGLPVLEIGPGLGALTGALIAASSRVVAVEIDRRMVDALSLELGDDPRLALIQCDFLKADLNALHGALGKGPFAVAANLPYYITTPICMRLLSSGLPIELMVLMMQREAARHLFTAPKSGAYGPLSALAQRYYALDAILELSPASFYPMPEVTSSVIVLRRKDSVAFDPGFPAFLGRAFAMRRKTLVNNLTASGLKRERAEALLKSADVDVSARAEALPPDVLALLAAALGALGTDR